MRYSITNSIYLGGTDFSGNARRIRGAGYDGVDFDLYNFCGEGGPLAGEDWRRWSEEVREAFAGQGLPVTQAHAVMWAYAPEDFAYSPPGEMVCRCVEACALLGCGELVFHPVLYPRVLETPAERERLMDYNLRWFGDLLPLAERLGVHICIENLFGVRERGGDPIFTGGATILELVKGLDSPFAGICLDTGHANIMERDIPGMVRLYGAHLRVLHLHDNWGPSLGSGPDVHVFPGSGMIDFVEIFRALEENGYSGLLNLEAASEHCRFPEAVEDVMIAGGLAVAKELARAAGLEK